MSDETLKDVILWIDALETAFLALVRAVGKEMRPAISELAREQLGALYAANPVSTDVEKAERHVVRERATELLKFALHPTCT